jgi:creatinine deaminase
MRQFDRVVVGDVTNASSNEQMLREKGIKVDTLENSVGIELYAKYRAEKPELDMEEWKGLLPFVRSLGLHKKMKQSR